MKPVRRKRERWNECEGSKLVLQVLYLYILHEQKATSRFGMYKWRFNKLRNVTRSLTR